MKKRLLGISIIYVSLCLAGCGGKSKTIQNNSTLPNPQSRGSLNIVDGRTKNYNNNFNNWMTSDNDVKDFEQKNLSANTRAEKIATAVENMAEIKEAYAVVTGNTAIVGINLEGAANDARLIEIKRLVEKEVKSTDSDINHVAVTASPELVEKITNMTGGSQTSKEHSDLEKLKDNEAFFRAAPTI